MFVVSARVMGLFFAANTVTVSACQLLVLKAAGGRRGTRAVVVMCGLWAVSWALVLTNVGLGAGWGKGLFVSAVVVFSLGETLFAPTLPALVNDVAPDALRGRYNGASTFALTTGFALGPILVGVLLQRHWGVPLLVCLMLACAVVATLATRLRRQLPSGTDIIIASSATDGTPTSTEGGPAGEPSLRQQEVRA
ncbi:MFS transporter [Streptomyces sp. NPDC047028]|uniref:MFS transporter n=1 Tax=Streptomyces sp. NPDC047028 TaxID=3155793 RepID=UPI00340C778F